MGTVLSVGDGVARVYGLDDCVMNELLEFEGGVRGVALNLEEDNVGCVLLGSATEVKEGQQVRGTGRIISVPTGEQLLGRVVNALGDPVDGKGPLGTADADLRPIEQDGPLGGRASARRRADADRHQGDRRHDPDRPRPA